MKITLELDKHEALLTAKCLNEKFKMNEVSMIINQIPKEDQEIMMQESFTMIKIIRKMNEALDRLIKDGGK
jgi:hypothetical protein